MCIGWFWLFRLDVHQCTAMYTPRSAVAKHAAASCCPPLQPCGDAAGQETLRGAARQETLRSAASRRHCAVLHAGDTAQCCKQETLRSAASRRHCAVLHAGDIAQCYTQETLRGAARAAHRSRSPRCCSWPRCIGSPLSAPCPPSAQGRRPGPALHLQRGCYRDVWQRLVRRISPSILLDAPTTSWSLLRRSCSSSVESRF
jgi:hypothetical protein